MKAMEIVYLVGALLAVGAFLFLVRRASAKHTDESARAVRERLERRTEHEREGEREEDKIRLDETVNPGDTLVVRRRLF